MHCLRALSAQERHKGGDGGVGGDLDLVGGVDGKAVQRSHSLLMHRSRALNPHQCHQRWDGTGGGNLDFDFVIIEGKAFQSPSCRLLHRQRVLGTQQRHQGSDGAGGNELGIICAVWAVRPWLGHVRDDLDCINGRVLIVQLMDQG